MSALCHLMEGSMPGSSVLHYLLDFLRFMSIESVMLSNHLISCCIFSSFAFNLSHHQGLFQWVDPFYQIAKVLELQLQCQFFQLIGLISCTIDFFDLHAVWGSLKCLLQHHNSRALILRHAAFFMIQRSHPYMSTGNTIALTIWTFICKVTSLLFNML